MWPPLRFTGKQQNEKKAWENVASLQFVFIFYNDKNKITHLLPPPPTPQDPITHLLPPPPTPQDPIKRCLSKILRVILRLICSLRLYTDSQNLNLGTNNK